MIVISSGGRNGVGRVISLLNVRYFRLSIAFQFEIIALLAFATELKLELLVLLLNLIDENFTTVIMGVG